MRGWRYRRVVKSVLPARKQVVALSATYSEALLAELEGLMTEPHHVMLCRDSVSLLGVKQFYQELPGALSRPLHASLSRSF